jgi:ribosome biogenesis GTPase
MSIKQNTYINDNIHHLSQMGWTSHFQRQLEPFSNEGLIPARVVGVRKNSFRTSNGKSEWLATLAGRLKHDPTACIRLQGIGSS